MTYRIEGIKPEPFEDLRGLDDAALAARNARRMIVDRPGAFPCRVTLEDVEPGEAVLLLNHVSHDVEGPFRASHAIFVREADCTPAVHRDETPTYLERRTLSLRGFDGEGMMHSALLAMPGEADAQIRALLEVPEIATIHAHNAARGCFLARIERD